MPLKIQLHSPLPARLDASVCTLRAWQTQALKQIQATSVFVGNRKEQLGEFFKIRGCPSDDTHVWEGDLSQVDGIGSGHSEGCIKIEGSAGRYIGHKMCGGRIDVWGDVSDFCGSAMSGGHLRIHGNAGHRLGGMRDQTAERVMGGEIVVLGSTGDDCGYRMRRGLIVIGKACGHRCGYQLHAGTLIVGGTCGSYPGLEMRRGTLVLGPSAEIPRVPYLALGSRCNFLILQLLRMRLLQVGCGVCSDLAVGDELSQAFDFLTENVEAAIYHGDLLEGGRGEILHCARA